MLTFVKIDILFVNNSFLVTALMGADLNSILKCHKLTDEHVQFLVYQILRGLKVGTDYAQMLLIAVKAPEVQSVSTCTYTQQQRCGTWQPYSSQ